MTRQAGAGPRGQGEPGQPQPERSQPGQPGNGRAVGPAGERPRFTSRAALLAVVVCAVALSLAYPVREYIAQRRQIDQLTEQHQQAQAQLRALQAEQGKLSSNRYVEQQARDKLHMCLPSQTCYVVITPGHRAGPAPAAPARSAAWYQLLWSSVQQADRSAGK
ncbi:MAG TPA: septum formation initiator family protein [Streptosporangiaceae bacterium]|jgi:cell division protein FtsL